MNTQNLSPKMVEALSKLSVKEFRYHTDVGLKLIILQQLKKRGLVESTTIHGIYPDTSVKIKWRLLPMKNQRDWINEHREFVGKKVYLIDFDKFLKDKKLTVEKLAQLIEYTFDGTIKMLGRGSIKISTFKKLKVHYQDLDSYKKIIK